LPRIKFASAKAEIEGPSEMMGLFFLTDSRDFPVSAKMRVAGQECPAYRVFEIAAFIPAPAYRQAPNRTWYGAGRQPVRTGQAQQGILQHFRQCLFLGISGKEPPVDPHPI
jgi:hypothetical protein